MAGKRDSRHRDGRGEDGRYDPGHRLEAARVQAGHPAWLVLWGAYSRRFWAFPVFAAPGGTIVTAGAPGDLVVLMRQAEMAAARPPPQHP